MTTTSMLLGNVIFLQNSYLFPVRSPRRARSWACVQPTWWDIPARSELTTHRAGDTGLQGDLEAPQQPAAPAAHRPSGVQHSLPSGSRVGLVSMTHDVVCSGAQLRFQRANSDQTRHTGGSFPLVSRALRSEARASQGWARPLPPAPVPSASPTLTGSGSAWVWLAFSGLLQMMLGFLGMVGGNCWGPLPKKVFARRVGKEPRGQGGSGHREAGAEVMHQALRLTDRGQAEGGRSPASLSPGSLGVSHGPGTGCEQPGWEGTVALPIPPAWNYSHSQGLPPGNDSLLPQRRGTQSPAPRPPQHLSQGRGPLVSL